MIKSYRVRSFIDSILAVLVLGGVSLACFLPTGIFLLAYFLLSPEGFWQKFVVFGFGFWFLGVFQGIGLWLFAIFWMGILLRSNYSR